MYEMLPNEPLTYLMLFDPLSLYTKWMLLFLYTKSGFSFAPVTRVSVNVFPRLKFSTPFVE